MALHYFDFETTISIFKEIFNILNNEGKTFITVKSPKDKPEMKYLKKTSKKIGENVYKTGIQIKSRFTREQWEAILQKAGIEKYTVTEYKEDLSGRGDTTKSGNTKYLLNEIRFNK